MIPSIDKVSTTNYILMWSLCTKAQQQFCNVYSETNESIFDYTSMLTFLFALKKRTQGDQMALNKICMFPKIYVVKTALSNWCLVGLFPPPVHDVQAEDDHH